jgi:hypothetical protein
MEISELSRNFPENLRAIGARDFPLEARVRLWGANLDGDRRGGLLLSLPRLTRDGRKKPGATLVEIDSQ